MDERKGFLNRLKAKFGDCGRRSFLQKLRAMFSGKASTPHDDSDVSAVMQESEQEQEQEQIISQYRVIDINGTDAWRDYVERLKDTSLLHDCLNRFNMLLKKERMVKYADSVSRNLAEIPSCADRRFKEPKDIDEDTSEKMARQIGAFVLEHIAELLRGCHSGLKYSQEDERQFYRTFADCLEQYLSDVSVYRKEINLDKPFAEYTRWFASPFTKEAIAADRIGFIDEIEFLPHVIPYRNDDGETEELILKGSCIVFCETKRK